MSVTNKEFDRSVCFQFYESYLEQAELVKEQLGPEMCAEYFIALVRYGLYQEESENQMIRMLIAGLKNTIDAGQSKRERAFGRQNTDQTDAILQYKQEHPKATQREIADACNCSVGKVNKAINSNLNNNINNNSNLTSNSNNNSVNVNMNKEEERGIEDLTEEEAKEIINKIHKKVKYIDIQQEYHLKYGSVTKDFEDQWRAVYIQRHNEYIESCSELYKELAIYLNRDVESTKEGCTRVEFFKERDIADIVNFCRTHPEYSFNNWFKERYNPEDMDNPNIYTKSQNKYIIFFRNELCKYEELNKIHQPQP